MSPRSRREVLHGLATLVVGTSGCATDPARESATPTATERRFPNGTRSPTARTLRHAGGETAVRSSVVTPDTEQEAWIPTEWLVTAPRGRRALAFSPGADGVDAVEALLAGTDLASATILIRQYGTPECLTRRLDRLRWNETGVALEYTSVERDVDCETDAPFDVEATVVRIPDAIERLDYFGSSVS